MPAQGNRSGRRPFWRTSAGASAPARGSTVRLLTALLCRRTVSHVARIGRDVEDRLDRVAGREYPEHMLDGEPTARIIGLPPKISAVNGDTVEKVSSSILAPDGSSVRVHDAAP